MKIVISAGCLKLIISFERIQSSYVFEKYINLCMNTNYNLDYRNKIKEYTYNNNARRNVKIGLPRMTPLIVDNNWISDTLYPFIKPSSF